MNKKISRVCCIFMVVVILITPSIGEENCGFPNCSISSTHIYNLNLDGDYELYTIDRIKNIDYDYIWIWNEGLKIPMHVSTFYSDEQPNVTMVTIGDVHADYTIEDYKRKSFANTYVHEYCINVRPPYPSGIGFNKDSTITIITKSEVSGTTLKLGDSQNFVVASYPLPKEIRPFKEFKTLIVRVNLPNDPYYWTETLDTAPKGDYRSPFGRGESLEWWYDGDGDGNGGNMTDTIIVSYRVHPDPLRKSLDEATKESEKSGKISVGLGVLSIGLGVLSIAIVIILEVVTPKFKKRKSKSK